VFVEIRPRQAEPVEVVLRNGRVLRVCESISPDALERLVAVLEEVPPSVRILVAAQLVDGRKGADSLMVLVRDVPRPDPLSGYLFVFFSKRCDSVRIVYWYRNGFAMWTRLERGRLSPPTGRDAPRR
jgi:transposase